MEIKIENLSDLLDFRADLKKFKSSNPKIILLKLKSIKNS
jgi:hypothetical protein